MGRGSLDFAKQLVAEEALGQPSLPRDIPWWQSRTCRAMETSDLFHSSDKESIIA